MPAARWKAAPVVGLALSASLCTALILGFMLQAPRPPAVVSARSRDLASTTVTIVAPSTPWKLFRATARRPIPTAWCTPDFDDSLWELSLPGPGTVVAQAGLAAGARPPITRPGLLVGAVNPGLTAPGADGMQIPEEEEDIEEETTPETMHFRVSSMATGATMYVGTCC